MRLLLAIVALALASAGAHAQAPTWPARPVTLIVPFAAGGPADVTGRLIAEQYSRHIGQRVIVENVVGAGGATGATRGARAAPGRLHAAARPHGHARGGAHAHAQSRLRSGE
jgi:tripartite-type tricarboxylate transporter receptor subunit TctC